MAGNCKVRSVETLSCDAGWRNYHFVKITTEDGVVGWSEFDEGFGSPGLGTAIERLAVTRETRPITTTSAITAIAMIPASRSRAGGV